MKPIIEAERLCASWYRQGHSEASCHPAEVSKLVHKVECEIAALERTGELPGTLAAECLASWRQGFLSGLHEIARSATMTAETVAKGWCRVGARGWL